MIFNSPLSIKTSIPFGEGYDVNWIFLRAQTVKNLPATRKTQIRSLGREDPLEKEMATTPVFLPGESHRQRSLVGLESMGSQSRSSQKSQTQLSN